MLELRDCVHKLISQQLDGFISDETIRETQAELNRLYDAFAAKYGLINSRGNSLAFSEDSSYYLLCSLEVIDEDGNLERKADMQPYADRRFPRLTFIRDVFDKAARVQAEALGKFNILIVQPALLFRILPHLIAVRHTIHSKFKQIVS